LISRFKPGSSVLADNSTAGSTKESAETKSPAAMDSRGLVDRIPASVPLAGDMIAADPESFKQLVRDCAKYSRSNGPEALEALLEAKIGPPRVEGSDVRYQSEAFKYVWQAKKDWHTGFSKLLGRFQAFGESALSDQSIRQALTYRE